MEEVIEQHPAIAEAAVAGTPSVEWGEEVTVYAVTRVGVPQPTIEELRDFCRDQLANYKLPRRLVAIEKLPRNALGKVVKHELRSADDVSRG